MNDAHDEVSHLSLSAASKLLGVHSTTLRRWADAGAVPVYITPGGHRRFARADIEGLAARQPLAGTAIGSTWASKALAVTRGGAAQSQERPGWMNQLPEDDRAAWRRIGQQLMGVVLRYINSPHEDEQLLVDARTIGADYARHARQAGMALTAALEAALFFRDSLVDAAMDMPEEAHLRPEASARLIKRISRVANEVHLAVAAGYQPTEE
ncbi:helix-turn-helix domain-containing protein [Oscillochloris sp. ZM17-4]|uniref:MerR family transcriptional regulator n=1 Tax=Oscillochloris sp. ZM17-4 TaxID=2866714 RepID=UPI001C72E70D|nr:helix-turn-helix domain-containing protein [Oscillochloris sp. ZM17-4]MBX0329426.1 helix-turn-helix domain-containing protein [Oscillochloris sp. ZM17-4]